MWGLDLIPVVLLVSMWGGEKKFVLGKIYFVPGRGSIFLLMGFLGVGVGLYCST